MVVRGGIGDQYCGSQSPVYPVPNVAAGSRGTGTLIHASPQGIHPLDRKGKTEPWMGKTSLLPSER